MSEIPKDPGNSESGQELVVYDIHALAREVILQTGTYRGDDTPSTQYKYFANWSDPTGALDYVLQSDSTKDNEGYRLAGYDTIENSHVLNLLFATNEQGLSNVLGNASTAQFGNISDYDTWRQIITDILLSAPGLDALPDTDDVKAERVAFWEMATQYATQSIFDSRSLARTASILMQTSSADTYHFLSEKLREHYEYLGIDMEQTSIYSSVLAEHDRRQSLSE